MSIFKRMAKPVVQKMAELVLTDPAGWGSYGGGISNAGISVGENTALQMTASWQAIRLISESIGTMPIHLYRRTDKGRERATKHKLYRLTKNKPSKFFTSVEWREGIGVGLTCQGHSYGLIQKFGNQVFSITPLTKQSCRPNYDRITNELTYKVTQNGIQTEYPQDEILSIKGFGGVGSLEGFAPFQMQKNALGASMAADAFASSFFSNGAAPGGWVEYEKTLGKEQRDEWYKNFSETHTGIGKAGKWKLLENGMKAVQNKVNNNDSQLLETRKHQIAEIARIWNVPLSKLMEMDRATYTNSEQENIQFINLTMNPYFVRIEEAFNSSLLTEKEQEEYYFEFDTRGFLRGDSAARAAYYKSMRESSAITPNEIRSAENLPEKEGGDDLHLPLNYAPIDLARELLKPDGE